MKARRAAARRKMREAISASPESESPVSDSSWDELQAAVHAEVCRLPEKLRLPFVLCSLQGRPQKDAAKQLGWTIGTLSGRLTLARQRLLDRLAKRGVPVGVAAGAAVLGVASGSAAPPSSLVLKALSAAAAPDAVSPVIHSLARGVTHMYLTRNKMLLAAVVVVGLLTTGIATRLDSKADAQTPKMIEDVEAKLEYLRAVEALKAREAAKDRFEYKFVAVEKTLTTADLQKQLSAHDRDGWEYCGSQDLSVSGKPVPHLTFKRPRQASSFNPKYQSALDAYFEAIAAGQLEKNAKDDRQKQFLEALKLYMEAAGNAPQKPAVDPKRSAKEREEYFEKLYKAQIEAAIKQQAEAADAAKVAEKQARDIAEAERARAIDAELKAKEMARAKAAAELQERARAEQLAHELQKALEEREALLRKLKEVEKGGKEDKGKGGENIVIMLKHADATSAVKMLEKIAPDIKVTAVDQRTNSIIIHGTADSAAKARDVIATIVDVEAPKKSADKIEIAIVPLKNVNSKDVLKLFSEAKSPLKSLNVTVEATSNSIIIAGPSAGVKDAKRVIEEMDGTSRGK
jgi:tetratricopeptide (TPR) repeat protein